VQLIAQFFISLSFSTNSHRKTIQMKKFWFNGPCILEGSSIKIQLKLYSIGDMLEGKLEPLSHESACQKSLQYANEYGNYQFRFISFSGMQSYLNLYAHLFDYVPISFQDCRNS